MLGKIGKNWFSLSVGVFALFCGLGSVGGYQILSRICQSTIDQSHREIDFDINDPESVLPIDFEEDKLSDPREDETNKDMFDPEGQYTLVGDLPIGFDEFKFFSIENKKLDVDCDDKQFGEFIAPKGFIQLKESSLKLDGSDLMTARSDYLEFQRINIGTRYLQFKTARVGRTTYEFNGEFLVDGNFYTLAPDKSILKGELIKEVNGKMVAIANVEFQWKIAIDCTC